MQFDDCSPRERLAVMVLDRLLKDKPDGPTSKTVDRVWRYVNAMDEHAKRVGPGFSGAEDWVSFDKRWPTEERFFVCVRWFGGNREIFIADRTDKVLWVDGFRVHELGIYHDERPPEGGSITHWRQLPGFPA